MAREKQVGVRASSPVVGHVAKSSSFETRRKRDAPQDEDLELGFRLILRRPRSGRLEG